MTLPLPIIAVGVDGSEDGLRAVQFGVRTALRRNGELLLVNAVDDAVLAGSWGIVYDPAVLQRAGETATEAAREYSITMGLPAERIRTEVMLGNPSAVLIRLSETADLIVVGRRAATGLERMFVGSTSVAIASAASCPVVIISAASTPQPTGDHGVVGVGIDSGGASLPVVQCGFQQAQYRSAKVRLIHILPPPMGLFSHKLTPAQLEQQLVYVAGGIEAMARQVAEHYPGVEFEVEVSAGNPVNDLVNRSEQLDLLIVGVAGSGLPGISLGGLTRGLMAHAKCPLMLTK